ncbi:MAG: YebC/PmpR family DNA-binding transcriptional regulator [SAR202 cluster bacterium]|jgi:YebC/PmpR family DNA-binding regulatory protein|nr:YebC/PmpR family DNA-binding transcriptional regulator [SAR202 cluster bacterium]
MSGHSKWSTIKHGKAVSDARRGQLFTKLAKEIIIAARQGGGDADSNFRLRMAVQRAKDNNMPASNIQRAVNRATGDGSDKEQIVEAVYEGYGPGGTAILLETLTDNKNRTVSEVRSTFSKAGGNMSEAGAVAWQFEQKGVVVVDPGDMDIDEITLEVIDAGADDFEGDNGEFHIYSAPENMESIRGAMMAVGATVSSAEVSMVPTNTVSLDEKTAKSALRLLDQLEELDDVQRVYSNADFPDEVLVEYGQED